MGDERALDLILHELGLTRFEFNLERHRLELSPREWFTAQIARLGYVPADAVVTLAKKSA